MDRLRHLFIKALDYTTNCALWLGGFLLVVMALNTTYGVVMRYIFDSPDPYSYEFNLMFLVISFVLAVPAVERLDRNIRVDFISNHLPPTVKNITFNIIAPLMALFYFSVLTWKGGGQAWFSLQVGQLSSSAWQVPLFPVKFIVSLGYGLLCLALIPRIVYGFTTLKDSIKKVHR